MTAPPHGSRHAGIAPAQLAVEASALLGAGYRLALAACHDDGYQLRAVYLFCAARPERRVELEVVVDPAHPDIPSLAGLSFPAGRFEREMHDLFGVVPLQHPLPRRLVRHPNWPAGWYPMRHDAGSAPAFAQSAEPYPFRPVEGPGVYEIPVGPVHAGLIEPGHFRFSVVGETILKLNARLWFVHRGMEKLFEGRTPEAGIELAERISGDTAAGHGLAYALAVEDALGIECSEGAQMLRALVLELERMYNHTADLGALANDVGFSLLNGHAQRLREQLLRTNEGVTGHRLLRGAIGPGRSVAVALPEPAKVAAIAAEVAEVARLILANGTVRDRFGGTATLSAAQAVDLGCLGYVARASGQPIDARFDHPTCGLQPEPVVHEGGDVLARFLVRRDEIAASAALIARLSVALGTPEHSGDRRLEWVAPQGCADSGAGVGMVEGWRGTIVTRVEIKDGHLTRVKVVDPSWFNWPALPVALTDTIVPDFPLANKSFNLSYAGNDL